MNEALRVTDCYCASIRHRRRQATICQLIIAPYADAAVAGECSQNTMFVGSKYKSFVYPQADIAGEILGPTQCAAAGVEAADTPLVSHRANLAPPDHRCAGDIRNSFQFSGAARIT